jgi:hypothetical protein
LIGRSGSVFLIGVATGTGDEASVCERSCPDVRQPRQCQDGTSIFDGDTGRMVGMVNMYGPDSFALDPLGRNFYVAQTIWSKRDRGVRQDMLLAYDIHTLKLAAPESMRQFRDSDKRA